MLYDPKWEVETKADPSKLETLIAWLEKQPANGVYVFTDCGGRCLFSLYLTDTIGSPGLSSSEGLARHLWIKFHKSDAGDIAASKPYTFGAALKRARKAAAFTKGER